MNKTQTEPNIVGSFSIEKAPKGAVLAQLNPTGEFVQTFLKQKTHKRNDGTEHTHWCFWGNFDTWIGFTIPDEEIFSADKKFLKVESQWKEVPWYANSYIPFMCQETKIGIMTVVLHREFICIDPEANDGYGSWTEGDKFAFTVRPHFSGRCPDTITTWDEAKEYVVRAALKC